ncbi:unnamed protein product [Durusdinium trenchii]|uniref:Carbohydrate kinase PfkB domain-containing protein n=1 Tax=Durusdinium trenchii TaxID=1381693 RepID=A0ABP0IQD4_9DINO
MEPSHGILVLGLNPGLQHILRLRSLDLGQVNRAEAHTLGVGGKGQNAAKAACTLALACEKARRRRVTVAQFLGGYTGEQIRQLQEQEGIEDITVAGAMTREFMTLVDFPQDSTDGINRVDEDGSTPCFATSPTVSELITPSEPVSMAAAEELLSKVVAAAPTFRGILLMGTWPSGTTRDFYMEAAKAKANDAVVLLDAAKPVQDVLDILEAGNVDIYKVNAMEICNLMGYGCKEGEASEEQIREVAAKALLRFSAVKHLAITDGAKASFLFSRDSRQGTRCTRYDLPAVPWRCARTGDFNLHSSCTQSWARKRILSGVCGVNPIGAGDTVAGVLMASLCFGVANDVEEAMLFGLAAGSAKVKSEGEGGKLDFETMMGLKAAITATRATSQ